MTDREFVLDSMRRLGQADAQALRTSAIAGQKTATELVAAEQQIPTWKQGNYPAELVGAPFQHEGQVYTLTQAHDSTGSPDWRPGVAYSLFDLKHTTDPAKAKPFIQCQGSWGLYQQNDVMVWTDGKVYRSKIANNSWTPATYATGWEEVTL